MEIAVSLIAFFGLVLSWFVLPARPRAAVPQTPAALPRAA